MKTKNRLLASVLCLLMVVFCVVGLTACGGDDECSHQWGEWTAITNATCTEAGVQERKCSECGETETSAINALGHDWNEATCSTPKTCKTCSVTEGTANAHAYTVETVKDEALKSAANCTSAAVYYKSCSCGAISTNDADTFTSGVALEHKDENTDHVCDNNCGKNDMGTHTDENKDHACDYGCNTAIGTCEDADKDHDCDYGCSKTFGVCEDTDKDHDCDYGCSKIIGEHTDGDDNNHLCDYGCGLIADDGCYDTVIDGKCDECGVDIDHTCVDENKNHACDICSATMGDHADGNKDHACDYGCSNTIGNCVDTDKDHNCDYGCNKVFGTCADENKDHDCDYGCNKTIGEHTDGDDNNHLCDYGCGLIADDGCYDTIVDGKCDECGADIDHTCMDENKNHACDICSATMGDHADGNKDHACDYGCNNVIGNCVDTDKDHDCDYGCNKVFGACADEDKDHDCDYGCNKTFGTCEDTSKDHACDYGCDKTFGACADEDKDHDCDYGCNKTFGTCEDTSKDHACDYGCDKTFGTCEDEDKDHNCDYGCNKAFGTCEDTDKDHACDYGCNKAFGTCEDTDKDHACDYGCNKAFGTCEDTDKDHACDYGCDKTLGTCEDEDKDHNCDYGCNKTFGEHLDSNIDDDHVCDYGCKVAIEYTATFKVDGTIIDTVKYTIGTGSITEPTVPTRVGYTGAWESYTLDEENITVNAVYTAIEYTITFVSNGGTEVSSITEYYGTVIEEPKAPTKDKYYFMGWFSSSGETPYEFTTMPAENITLYAKWESYSLTLTYDETTQGVSALKEITAETFGAACVDNFGNQVNVVVNINGNISPGETITVRLTASANGVIAQRTISNLKVYGEPTLSYDNSVDYFNIKDGLTPNWFKASGLDSFGNDTTIKVYINYDYHAGQYVTVTIESVDSVGNSTFGYIDNVKVYGLPEISYNENKTAIRVNDIIDAELFEASTKDSFGNQLTTTVEIADVIYGFINGDVYNYTTSTTKDYKHFTALDSGTYTLHYKNGAYGDRTYIMIYCVTTDNTVKSASYYTNYSSYNTMSFSVTAGYEYYVCTYAYSSSYTTEFSMYLTSESCSLVEGATAIVRISAIDSKNNVSVFDIECKVYGMPTINAENLEFKETDTISIESIGINAKDTFDADLDVSLKLKSGEQIAGNTMIYTITTTDSAGNIASKDVHVKIYGTPTITYDQTAIRVEDVLNSSNDYVNIVFESNGGTEIQSQVVTQNTGIKYPNIPTKEGYAFKGWYRDVSCTEIYDFTEDVVEDMTLYAGWVQMATARYQYYIDARDYYSAETNYTVHSYGPRGVYFTVFKDCDFTIFFRSSCSAENITSSYGLYTTYKIDNVTQNTTLQSNYCFADTSWNSLNASAKAGDVICITVNYGGAAGGFPSFYFYVEGMQSPVDGGVLKDGLAMQDKTLHASATDSFGNNVPVSITLKSGEQKGGEYVVYTLTAVDHLGNVAILDTENIPVYDINDIKLTYSAGISDLIKINSKGEEFGAIATDAFGNACELTIEPAEGYQLTGGNIISLYIVATDAVGNKIYSDIIENIKVYDTPYVEKNIYVTNTTDVSFVFSAYDSFGEELYTEISYTGELIVGNYLLVTVKAIDDAGNILLREFSVPVVNADGSKSVDLYVDGIFYGSFFADKSSKLPIVGDDFSGWEGEDGLMYTYSDGVLLKDIKEHTKLYATNGYIPISSPDDLKSIGMNDICYLTNDIDLTGTNWIPLGTEDSPFTGTFNGNGYKFYNMNINGSYRYTGLFGYNSGILKNIVVHNFTITATNYWEDYYNGYTYVGGIVGYNSGLVLNCSTNGNTVCKISMRSSSKYYAYAGGLIGYNAGTVSGCNSEGVVNIVSSSTYSSSGSRNYAGGLIGYNSYGSIKECYTNVSVSSTATFAFPNTGNATATSIAGGIVGFNNYGSISNCYSIGDVSTKSESTSVPSSNATIYAGGLVAYSGGIVGDNNYGTIENCYSTGAISALGTSASSACTGFSVVGGGIVARDQYGTIRNCYALGDITTSNTGSFYPSTYIGGIIGYSKESNVNNCFASNLLCATSGKYVYAGEIIGYTYNEESYVINCYYVENQNSNLTGTTITECSLGSISTYEELKTVDFYTNSLMWDTTNWILADGQYPTLK